MAIIMMLVYRQEKGLSLLRQSFSYTKKSRALERIRQTRKNIAVKKIKPQKDWVLHGKSG